MERPSRNPGSPPLASPPWQPHRRPWHTPIDLRKGLQPQEKFRSIYAPGTRQNRAGKPGLYRFHLAHTWTTSLLPDGPYHLEVEATDLHGNKGNRQLPFTLTNDL